MIARFGTAGILLTGVTAALLLIAGRSTSATAAISPLPPPTFDAPLAPKHGQDTAVLAGGCFWGIEEVFQHVKGVKDAMSGYAGGTVASPSYEEVSSGETGHAESVLVIYDPAEISYGQLLRIFFSVAHDPTQLNRQGPDVGTQYRSAIFYRNDLQHRIAKSYIEQLTKAKLFSKPIVTQVAPLSRFNMAEAYHQDYARQHPNQPYIVFNDAPKVKNLKKDFASLYR
ncbi:MAG TPA: peptide-methionine (S)-S-oxide reductase MsrA [Gemmatimonadaceae bacterium]